MNSKRKFVARREAVILGLLAALFLASGCDYQDRYREKQEEAAAEERLVAMRDAALEEDAELNDFLVDRINEVIDVNRGKVQWNPYYDYIDQTGWHLGLPPADLRDLENRKRALSAAEFRNICNKLGLSHDEFLNAELSLPVADSALALRIAQRRVEMGMTREDLAQAVGLSSGQDVMAIEHELRALTATEWRRIAEALDVDMINPGQPKRPKGDHDCCVVRPSNVADTQREIEEIITAGEWLRVHFGVDLDRSWQAHDINVWLGAQQG